MQRMTTVVLNGDDFADRRAVYARLAALLDFPGWFGMNADALHDLMTARPPVRCVLHAGNGPAAATVRMIARVMSDCGCEVILNG